MAELGLKTNVGSLTKSDQTYNPKTVFPDPGGATISNSLELLSSSFLITSEEAIWDGLSFPVNPIFPKLDSVIII